MPQNAPSVAITIDDFEWETQPRPMTPEAANRRLLSALKRRGIQAGVFVNGQYVDEGQGPRLLRMWDDAGHRIGNHTYSHNDFDLPATTLRAFTADIARNEEYLVPLHGFRRYFRYPFLHEGNTRAKRSGLRALLARRGYRIAPVTIPTCDWAIDDRLRARLRRHPNADLVPYKDFYREHVRGRMDFYDGVARSLIGIQPPHLLLLHYTLLNVLFLDDILNDMARRGWKIVDADMALEHPFYKHLPDAFPSDGSVLWTWLSARFLARKASSSRRHGQKRKRGDGSSRFIGCRYLP